VIAARQHRERTREGTFGRTGCEKTKELEHE
jgi:hypothetical protein